MALKLRCACLTAVLPPSTLSMRTRSALNVANGNVNRPEPEYRIIKDRNQYYTEPKPLKGYYIDKDSVRVGVHSEEFYGYGFLSYRMVRLE